VGTANASVFLKSDNSFLLAGLNTSGQLGLNTAISRSSPIQEITNGSWLSVATNGGISGGVKTDGTLWTWGAQTNGRGGINSTTNNSSPIQEVLGLTSWAQIAFGTSNTYALTNDGKLYAAGSNTNGGLGVGDSVARSSFAQVGSDTNWLQISASSAAGYGIKTDNTLWVWGYNINSCLGTSNGINYSSPVQLLGTNWLKVSAGYGGAYALKNDNTIWAWGLNSAGQLGQNDASTRNSPVQILGSWIDVKANASTVIMIDTQNRLWGTGSIASGQLPGFILNQSSPVLLNSDLYWISLPEAGLGGTTFVGIADPVYRPTPTPTPT
jgi:alpha-tubulin suppressor-like RCC1 family protein